MGIKISEMTPDASVGGSELIPVSDAGSPKSVTTAVLKQYVIDAIEALTAGTDALTGDDSMFVMVGGVMKPVDIDLVSNYVRSVIWGKADNAAPVVTDKIAIIDTTGATENTITLTSLSTLVLATIRAAMLNAATLDAHATLIAADKFMVTSGTTGKYCTFAVLSAAIYAALNTYITALNAVTVPADSDYFHVIQGSTEKKVTLAVLKTALGSTVAPATTTENKLAQWSSAQKTLKDGLTVQAAIRESGTAVDTAVATEKAVRDAFMPAFMSGSGVVMRVGTSTTEGLETFVVDVVVTLGSTDGVAVATIPIGAVLRSVQANIATAATAGGTSTKVGIGIDANPDAYGLTSVLTQNAKINTMLDWNALAGAVAIEAYPVTDAGAIGDTAFTAGTLRVRIVYDQLNSLDDAV